MFDGLFFGSHSGSLRLVRASGGKLVTDDEQVRRALAMTTGMRDPELPLDAFDCFFLHGLINPNRVLANTLVLAQDHALHQASVSSGMVRAAAEEFVRGSLLLHMLTAIRSATDAPVIATPQPYLSHAVIDDPVQGLGYRDLARLDTYLGPTFGVAYDAAMTSAAERLRFEILPQPAETVTHHGCFTVHSYCKGSVRLSPGMDIEHPADDFAHMGLGYGTLVLRDLEHHLVGRS
jgi:hypothetical protein